MSLSRRIEEQILLLKIRHGDQAAFALVYDRYVDALFRFIAFRVRTHELAQDISSEVFLRVWQHLTSGEREVQNLRAYLYQVARNLIADHYRKAQELLSLDDAMSVPAKGEASHTNIEQRLALADIERALTKLRDDWQEVVILAYVEGMKPHEIAPIIGKSRGSTRVLLHRALQELRRILAHN